MRVSALILCWALLAACDDSVRVTIKVKTADAGAAATSTTAMACCQADTATKAVP